MDKQELLLFDITPWNLTATSHPEQKLVGRAPDMLFFAGEVLLRIVERCRLKCRLKEPLSPEEEAMLRNLDIRLRLIGNDINHCLSRENEFSGQK